MKSTSSSLLAVAVLMMLAGNTQAQVLTAGAFALDGSSVINLGPVQYAYNLSDQFTSFFPDLPPATTLNGPLFPVTYTAIDPFVTSSSDFSLTTTGFDTTNNKDGTGATINPGDPLYNLQARGVFGTPTLTLNGLTVGTKYALQLVIGEQPADNRSQIWTDGSVNSPQVFAHSGPQYILDVFTATAATETLHANIGGGGGAQLTGFALEQDVPEPSTYALMLGGLAFLGFCIRRKGALVK
jgi:hypothetical protein